LFEVIAIVGESCSGKTTISKSLADIINGNEIISLTSRPPRDGEVNGEDYWYVTEEVIDILNDNGELIEYTIHNGNKYALAKSDFYVNQSNIVVCNLDGVDNLIDYFGEDNIILIRVHATENTRRERALIRDLVEPNIMKKYGIFGLVEYFEKIMKRFTFDREMFGEFENRFYNRDFKALIEISNDDNFIETMETLLEAYNFIEKGEVI